jgi:hypothetical protein
MASMPTIPSIANIWQSDIQKSLARDYMFNLGYIGESMHHIPGYLDVVNPAEQEPAASKRRRRRARTNSETVSPSCSSGGLAAL